MIEATQRLLELGLTDKEACVYLAMLELGPAAVQDIAKKADVNRTTVYMLLEDLMQRGLATVSVRDKRTLYTAESPARLSHMLDTAHLDIQSKKQKLQDAMPYFLALFNAIEDKPQVRFFEGEDGISSAREAMMTEPDAEFLSFTAIDEGTLRMADIETSQRHRFSRRVSGRLIVSFKPGCELPPSELKNWQVRELPYALAPFTGEINILGNKVAAYVVKTKPIGFVVESKELSDLFRTLYEGAWLSAKPWEPPSREP